MTDEKKRGYAYLEAWNGMLVRFPADHIKQWKARQEEIRKNPEAWMPDQERVAMLIAKMEESTE